MKKKIPFLSIAAKSKHKVKIIISNICALLVVLFCSVTSNAQQSIVPNTFATATGVSTTTVPFSDGPRTYQLLIAGSELTNLIGQNLSSISFRLPSSATTAWPSINVTFSNFDIYLSESVNPSGRSFTFASNVIGPQTLVRSGSLTIPAGSFPVGLSVNEFYEINFSTPWTYTGGSVLMELRHTGSGQTAPQVDAVTTTTNGFGNLFSSCFGITYTATSSPQASGGFAIIRFKSGNLGSVNFDHANLSVFPNPTSDFVMIETQIGISNIVLFNMLGQVVLTQKTDGNSYNFSIAHLDKGTYLLQVETETGVVRRKIVKK